MQKTRNWNVVYKDSPNKKSNIIFIM